MKNSNLTLSKKSTMLSAVRTLLSFVRTSFVCVSLAIAIIQLHPDQKANGFTITLFILAGVSLIIGVAMYFFTKRYVNDINDDEGEE